MFHKLKYFLTNAIEQLIPLRIPKIYALRKYHKPIELSFPCDSVNYFIISNSHARSHFLPKSSNKLYRKLRGDLSLWLILQSVAMQEGGSPTSRRTKKKRRIYCDTEVLTPFPITLRKRHNGNYLHNEEREKSFLGCVEKEDACAIAKIANVCGRAPKM